jgi:hypothetical protein
MRMPLLPRNPNKSALVFINTKMAATVIVRDTVQHSHVRYGLAIVSLFISPLVDSRVDDIGLVALAIPITNSLCGS